MQKIQNSWVEILHTSLNLFFHSNESKVIQLHDKKFEIFITEEEINFAIFIGVLNGSFMVVSDLLKKYKAPCEVSFVKMASYEGMQTTNKIKQLIGVNQNLEGRSVIVVEDIVDTGNTIEELKALLKEHHVKHFKIATLFLKPDAYTKDIKLDYVGIRIPDKFIVGYGLDYDGLGRNLKDVYQLSE